MRIGIFDSGSGGRFVAEKLRRLLPEHNYIVVDDCENAPYGERSYEDIEQLTHTAIAPLLETCDIIILACNTATAAEIDSLRQEYPRKTFIGFEPMIRPASLSSQSRHVTLLATKATCDSNRTRQLIERFGPDLKIDMPSTVGWAKMIDRDKIDLIVLTEVEKSIASGSDTIIIGCTHYIALIDRLTPLGVEILEPTEAIARRIRQLATELPR